MSTPTRVHFSVRRRGDPVSSIKHLETGSFARDLDDRIVRLSHSEIPTLVWNEARGTWQALGLYGSRWVVNIYAVDVVEDEPVLNYDVHTALVAALKVAQAEKGRAWASVKFLRTHGHQREAINKRMRRVLDAQDAIERITNVLPDREPTDRRERPQPRVYPHTDRRQNHGRRETDAR